MAIQYSTLSTNNTPVYDSYAFFAVSTAFEERIQNKWIKMPARKPEEEQEIMKWIEEVMEEPLPKGDYEEV